MMFGDGKTSMIVLIGYFTEASCGRRGGMLVPAFLEEHFNNYFLCELSSVILPYSALVEISLQADLLKCPLTLSNLS